VGRAADPETGKPPTGIEVDIRGQVVPMREMFQGLGLAWRWPAPPFSCC